MPQLTAFSSFPKVGIRPTIDGRLGGVRESLEEQCMNQAKAVVALIAENLRYPDGSAVECVIADHNIGGVAEAAACAEKFKRENVGVSLTVTPCWCYGSENTAATRQQARYRAGPCPRCPIYGYGGDLFRSR